MVIEKLVSIQIFSVIWLPTFWYDIHVHSIWIQKEVMHKDTYELCVPNVEYENKGPYSLSD